MNSPILKNVKVIDAEFMQPGFAATYLIWSGDEAAFVDTGTTFSIPLFLKALEEESLSPDMVKYVILTHIHLDHAGGASALMDTCPNAKLVVHRRGARHMIDPTILLKGTYAVFGEENAKRLYGTIHGIDENRVLTVNGEMDLFLQDRKLHLFDAPGHAWHHIAIWDETSRCLFTGDCFGLSYKFFTTDKGDFIFPTTTPIHFSPDDMHQTVNRCAQLNPEWICPTHFGPISDIPLQVDRMHRLIDAFVDLTKKWGAQHEVRDKKLKEEMGALLYTELKEHGVTASYEDCLPWLEKDLDLNTQGLIFWWDSQNGS